MRDLPTHAADRVLILPGLTHFEMTPTTEVEAVTTSGESKHITTSKPAVSPLLSRDGRKLAIHLKWTKKVLFKPFTNTAIYITTCDS